jgi:VWFA-related protein
MWVGNDRSKDMGYGMAQAKRNSGFMGCLAAALVGCLLLTAMPARAGQAAPPAKPAASKPAHDPDVLGRRLATIHIQSNLVVAPVTVTDRQGDLVEDLNESDFRVFDNGAPQQISHFALTVQPVAVVVVVQANQSVEPLLEQVRPVGPELSGLLVGKEGVAAVLSFADRVHVLQNFTNDPATIKTAVNNIKEEGSKARLNDALARAILMLAERPSGERRVIMVFSEGYDHGSETNRQEIVQAAANADVSIYGLRFDPTEILLKRKDSTYVPQTLYNAMALPGVPGQPNSPASTETYQNPGSLNPLGLAAKTITAARSARPKARSLVWQYAQLTGGVSYSHWGKAGLQNQIQRIALDINSQYILAYVPNNLNETGFHRLQVQVMQPRLNLRYRAGYFYGPVTKAPTKALPKIKPKKNTS